MRTLIRLPACALVACCGWLCSFPRREMQWKLWRNLNQFQHSKQDKSYKLCQDRTQWIPRWQLVNREEVSKQFLPLFFTWETNGHNLQIEWCMQETETPQLEMDFLFPFEYDFAASENEGKHFIELICNPPSDSWFFPSWDVERRMGNYLRPLCAMEWKDHAIS